MNPNKDFLKVITISLCLAMVFMSVKIVEDVYTAYVDNTPGDDGEILDNSSIEPENYIIEQLSNTDKIDSKTEDERDN